MFSTAKISLAVALTAVLTSTAAIAAPGEECDLDSPLITTDCNDADKADEIEKVGDGKIYPSDAKVLTHEEASLAYEWYAKWFDEKWADVELIKVTDGYDLYKPTGIVDGGEIVDEEPADDAEDDDWEWLKVIIKILLAAAENADDIVYNSVYDGTIYSPSNNTSAAAVLQLRRLGNNVSARLWTDAGLVADVGSFLTCPDVDIPAGLFPFEMQMVSGTLRAEGQVTKQVSLLGFGAGSVTAEFSVQVLSDYEHLVADVAIDAPFGCSDTAMTGTFTRRIGSEFQ